MVSVVGIMAEFTIAPALVDSGPSYNGWMVDVSFDSSSPFLIESVGHFSAIVIAACHFSEDIEAEAVCPVVKARVFSLLVLPRATGRMKVS